MSAGAARGHTPPPDRHPAHGPMLIALLSLGVGMAAAALVARRSGIGLGAVLRGPPLVGHALALGAFGAELLARGLRISWAGRGLGLRIPVGRAVRAKLAADALGAVTPSRVGADAAKLTILQRAVTAGPAAAVLLAEAGSEALVLLGAALVLLCTDAWWVALGPLAYAAAVTASGATALLVTRRPRADPPGLWTRLRLRPSRWRALRRAARSFHEHARTLRSIPRRWGALVVAAALLHMAARLALLPILVISMTATPPPLADLVLRPFFLLYATSLLPPPGGGGGVEVGFTTLLGGVLAAVPLAAGLVWWRVYTFYLSAVIGWLDLVVRKAPRTMGWIQHIHNRPKHHFTKGLRGP